MSTQESPGKSDHNRTNQVRIGESAEIKPGIKINKKDPPVTKQVTGWALKISAEIGNYAFSKHLKAEILL